MGRLSTLATLGKKVLGMVAVGNVRETQLLLVLCVIRWPNVYGGHSEYFLRPCTTISIMTGISRKVNDPSRQGCDTISHELVTLI